MSSNGFNDKSIPSSDKKFEEFKDARDMDFRAFKGKIDSVNEILTDENSALDELPILLDGCAGCINNLMDRVENYLQGTNSFNAQKGIELAKVIAQNRENITSLTKIADYKSEIFDKIIRRSNENERDILEDIYSKVENEQKAQYVREVAQYEVISYNVAKIAKEALAKDTDGDNTPPTVT